jgi:hypothetical protein
MKTHSDIEIPVFQNLGTNRWYYHFNHKGNVIADDLDAERIEYEADTVVISGNPEKQKIEAALQSPVTDKGEPDEVYLTSDAPELDTDIGLILSYTDDVYRSITRQEQEGLEWIRNEVVKKDSRRWDENTEYICIQPHITQTGMEPHLTPALWNEYHAEGEIIDWYQPTGAHDAFRINALMRYTDGNVYKSLIDYNTYSPTTYPAGWQLIE